jgi:PIN domain nuclease of toxin-antitoxin system
MAKLFDSSAVLAFLFNEPGSEKVRSALSDGAGLISAVNAGEVLLVLVRDGMSLDGAVDALCMTRLTTVPFSLPQAVTVGEVGFLLRSRSRKHGLSLGDHACIASALWQNIPVVTADRIWVDLQIPNLQVELIR